MSRQRRIEYMIDRDTGLVWSRVGSEVAIPVLDFAGMKPENSWMMNYSLEKFSIYHQGVINAWVIHTRKIPLKMKNFHRKFWGMKPIKE